MRPSFTASILVSLALSFMVTVTSARGDAPATDPNELTELGLRLRTEGRDAEALEKFQAAYAVSPEPRLLAQIALAEQALGRIVPAYEHLRQALDNTQDPWIAKWRSELDGTLRQIEGEFALLEVHCNVPGAAVIIGDQFVGRTPLAGPLRVTPGSVAVRVEAEGFVPATQAVTTMRAQQSRLDVALVPPAPAPAPIPPPVAIPVSTESVARQRNPLWLIGVGVGAATALSGAVTYAISGKKADSLEKDCYDQTCEDDERNDRRKTVRALDRASRALAAVGLVTLLGSGAAYLWAKGSAPEQAPSVRVQASVGASYAVLYGTIKF